jgi:hypothetical protein
MVAPAGAYAQHSPVEIFQYVIEQLKTSIEGADESSCFFTENPDEFPEGGAAFIAYTVSPSPTGSFLEDEFVGGGLYNMSTSTYVVVTAHVQRDLDFASRIDISIEDDNRSLFTHAKHILKALAMYYPQRPGTTEYVFNEPLIPSNFTMRFDGRRASVQVAFRVDFNWDVLS